jgi:hypothetical protein
MAIRIALRLASGWMASPIVSSSADGCGRASLGNVLASAGQAPQADAESAAVAGAIMKNASWGDILLTWMEALRAWLLQQSWLGFAHDWIATAAPEMIWLALIVLAAVLVVGIGFCWPRRRRA